jgi:hypothetical protein
MPGRLTQGELVEAVNDVFRVGVPALSFLRLSKEDAKSYADILDFQVGWRANVSGPSLDNDPLHQEHFYSVIVTRRVV